MQTDCPCDLSELIRLEWANCPALVDCLPVDQIAKGEYLGDPASPWVIIEEQTSTPLSCNSDGDLYQTPIFVTIRCFKDKALARKIRKAFYRKFHRKLIGAATECGTICDFSLTWPNIAEIDYQFVVRFQATVRLSVPL